MLGAIGVVPRAMKLGGVWDTSSVANALSWVDARRGGGGFWVIFNFTVAKPWPHPEGILSHQRAVSSYLSAEIHLNVDSSETCVTTEAAKREICEKVGFSRKPFPLF